MNEQDFMNMMSNQIKEKSVEHPGIPTVELSTMVLMRHVAILYARLDENKWPTPLVERIAAIDLQAAQWIVDHWDDLLEDKYTYKNNYSRDCDTLTHMFDWETPPQGIDYWGSISDKLGE